MGQISRRQNTVCIMAWSPYRDAWRKYKDHNRLKQAAKNAEEIREGVYLGAQALVFDEIQKIAGTGDYREFAAISLTGQ